MVSSCCCLHVISMSHEILQPRHNRWSALRGMVMSEDCVAIRQNDGTCSPYGNGPFLNAADVAFPKAVACASHTAPGVANPAFGSIVTSEPGPMYGTSGQSVRFCKGAPSNCPPPPTSRTDVRIRFLTKDLLWVKRTSHHTAARQKAGKSRQTLRAHGKIRCSSLTSAR